MKASMMWRASLTVLMLAASAGATQAQAPSRAEYERMLKASSAKPEAGFNQKINDKIKANDAQAQKDAAAKKKADEVKAKQEETQAWMDSLDDCPKTDPNRPLTKAEQTQIGKCLTANAYKGAQENLKKGGGVKVKYSSGKKGSTGATTTDGLTQQQVKDLAKNSNGIISADADGYSIDYRELAKAQLGCDARSVETRAESISQYEENISLLRNAIANGEDDDGVMPEQIAGFQEELDKKLVEKKRCDGAIKTAKNGQKPEKGEWVELESAWKTPEKFTPKKPEPVKTTKPKPADGTGSKTSADKKESKECKTARMDGEYAERELNMNRQPYLDGRNKIVNDTKMKDHNIVEWRKAVSDYDRDVMNPALDDYSNGIKKIDADIRAACGAP